MKYAARSHLASELPSMFIESVGHTPPSTCHMPSACPRRSAATNTSLSMMPERPAAAANPVSSAGSEGVAGDGGAATVPYALYQWQTIEPVQRVFRDSGHKSFVSGVDATRALVGPKLKQALCLFACTCKNEILRCGDCWVWKMLPVSCWIENNQSHDRLGTRSSLYWSSA